MQSSNSFSHSFPLVAGGNINPSVFIKQSTIANNTALQASTGDVTIGITAQSTEAAPVDGAATYHATAGHGVDWYGPGATCLLTLGTGGCAAGDFLKSDSNGCGVTASTDKDAAGARAIQAGAAGEKVMVVVGITELSK